MRLTRIAAHSFRNLSPDPVFFGGGRTVIAGENAQGKTNLLEAIALVCGQRSFRRARPQEMAAGEAGVRVEVVLAGAAVRRHRSQALAATASAGELSRVVALTKLAEWRAVARAAGEAPLFGVDEFDAGLSAGGVEAFVQALPPAETVLLATASEPSRWRRLAGAAAATVVEMRAGRVHERPRAVNDQGVAGAARAHAS